MLNSIKSLFFDKLINLNIITWVILFENSDFIHKINMILKMNLLGMEKTRHLFKFYYIGAEEYFGSQRQPNYLTIEDCLLTALQEKNYINETKESGFEVASRTDKFVSARGSTFSFICQKILASGLIRKFQLIFFQDITHNLDIINILYNIQKQSLKTTP